jgi:putative aldouronate transport system substrate-binding protein
MKKNLGFLRGLAAVAILLAMGLAVSGCSQKQASGGGAAGLPDLDTSKRVELILYVFGTEPARQQEVDDNLNKILLEKLNCTLDVRFISLSEYNTTYPLLFSSGEVFDLAYCAYWLNYTNLAQRGAFMALDELFPKYAPLNYARQSASALQQAQVEGKIYCIPALMKVYSAFGPQVRMDLVQPYGFDGKMENYADLERYLDIIKANYPAIDPYEVDSSGTFLDDVFMYTKGMMAMGSYFWMDPFQENPKLLTYYEFPPIAAEYLPMVQRFAQKGFYPRNALAEQSTEKFRFGNAASAMTNLEMYEGYYRDHPEWNIQFHNWVTDLSYQAFTQDVAVIPATSKNPERALALYDLITNDEEVFRALFYGIRGVSYDIELENGEERIVFPDSDNFAISNFWAARTDEFFLQFRGGPPTMSAFKADWSSRIKDGVGAQKFKALTLDTAAIDTEYAAANNVMTQYWNPLSLGFVEPVAGLAEFKANMEAAGIERIRAHFQKQLDDYIASLK